MVAIFVAVFIGLSVFDVVLISSNGALAKKLSRQMNSYKVALGDDPTKVAIDASSVNVKKLEEHLKFLENDLTRASSDIFLPLTAKEGYQLVEQLRGFVNSWRKEARKLDIRIDDKMDFGFKKYVAPNAEAPKDEAIAGLWKQACVLNHINKKLFACKSAESPMGIFAVQREILESEGVKETKQKTRNARARRAMESQEGDNFKIDPAITARKKGSLDTLAYRFVFAGHTDVLRRFLNQLKDFDAMLVVRSINVKPADMSKWDQLAPASNNNFGGEATEASNAGGLDAIFGASNESNSASEESTNNPLASESAPARTPVVTDNISEFAVVIEYVEVVNTPEKKKDGDKKDGENK